MVDKLRVLLRLSAGLAKERDVRKVLMELTDVTKLLLDADRCSIFLHDPKTEELWTIVAHNISEIRIRDDVGIAGHVFTKREVVSIPDAYADPRFNTETDRRSGYRTHTILGMPLVNHEGVPLGVFQVINKVGSVFNDEDIEMLSHVGLYAASTLESAILYEKLARAHKDVIYKLSSATKFKDPETQNHIIRVGLYCEVLGEKLGWNQEDIDLIKLAAPMHDIGKVGIPDVILQKPGSLDAEEWKVMRKHTLYGYEILAGGDSRILEMARDLALDHHEKWDGSGYPSGKAGTAITLVGRMCAISDVFDALTSKRSYKEPWPPEKVKELLMSEKGRQFDPEITQIFLDTIETMFEIKRTYKDEG